MAARTRISTGTPWEDKVGYSRAVRVGDSVYVTGTVGISADGSIPKGAYAQARRALEIVEAALVEAGSGLADVVRTRIYVTDIEGDWEEIGRAHAERLGLVRPATTMVEVRKLIAPAFVVEIEADAMVGSAAPNEP